MSATLVPRSASPARGVVRGLRAGALAALCVLLPLAGHLLAQGHMPRWALLLGMAAIAVPGAVLLTRHKLSDTQLMAALVGSQLAHHAAYSLPGACAAVSGSRQPVALVEHASTAGAPPEVFLAGHLVMLVLAAHLFGLTERLLWCGKPVLEALRALLMFVWPLLPAGNGPKAALRDLEPGATPPSAIVVRLHAGRAPPRGGHAVPWRAHLPTPGLSSGGGFCPA
ncbi:hypothetical protein ABTX80_28135 [Streptomyces erythrochromogenes]|uniref:hypothetical protein n=1 Tax=Streptomyces erythrochromogenes TaxID=285574 RepID=UPI0033260481